MNTPRQLQAIGLEGFPAVKQGDNLAVLIQQCLKDNDLTLQTGDILVLAQKIVSKSEGRKIPLSTVEPGEKARQLAGEIGKDPRLVELILSESRALVRKRDALVIVEHRNGYVHATAGIDFSNVRQPDGDLEALLLPNDPDASAGKLRSELQHDSGVSIGIIISDSMGRAWRNGIVGQAIGCSGVTALSSRIGQLDLYGRALETTEVGIGDELAAAASLLMGQGAEGIPVVLLRGMSAFVGDEEAAAKDLIRDPATDLFRDW